MSRYKPLLFRIWRLCLPLIFLFVLIHLLKDLTQDIFQIRTPLDIFGDAKEDLSSFSLPLRYLYTYGLGGLSLVAEIFLLLSIPIILSRKQATKLERFVALTILLLSLFLLSAVILDPRF